MKKLALLALAAVAMFGSTVTFADHQPAMKISLRGEYVITPNQSLTISENDRFCTLTLLDRQLLQPFKIGPTTEIIVKALVDAKMYFNVTSQIEYGIEGVDRIIALTGPDVELPGARLMEISDGLDKLYDNASIIAFAIGDSAYYRAARWVNSQAAVLTMFVLDLGKTRQPVFMECGLAHGVVKPVFETGPSFRMSKAMSRSELETFFVFPAPIDP